VSLGRVQGQVPAYILLMDANAVRERVASLKEEIQMIRKENLEYASRRNHVWMETREHEKRMIRLEEILQELASLSNRTRPS